MPPKKKLPKKPVNPGASRKGPVTANRNQNPLIHRLQKAGWTNQQIRVYLDQQNGDKDLTRGQYRAIGYTDQQIARIRRRGGGGGGAAGGGSAGGGAGGGAGGPIVDYDQSAYDVMLGLLKEYGLGSLAGTLRDLMVDGVTDQASITLALQDTDEWKQRFIGNEKLKAAGLPALSVAEYLATERSMAQIMKSFGLPEGFYDDPNDFGNFIGNAVSPAELQERVQSYSDLVNRDDPAVKAQLRAMGMTDGDLLAFMMDPERANPLIQKKYKAALVGAAARRTGLETSNEYADRLAGMGITEQQAQAGYAAISEGLSTFDRLGDIYGEDYNQSDFEAEVFEGDGSATRKRKRLASQERAAFGGSSGVAQGSLRRSSAGQY